MVLALNFAAFRHMILILILIPVRYVLVAYFVRSAFRCFVGRPDMTFAVGWELNNNDLSIYRCFVVYVARRGCLGRHLDQLCACPHCTFTLQDHVCPSPSAAV